MELKIGNEFFIVRNYKRKINFNHSKHLTNNQKYEFEIS